MVLRLIHYLGPVCIYEYTSSARLKHHTYGYQPSADCKVLLLQITKLRQHCSNLVICLASTLNYVTCMLYQQYFDELNFDEILI